MLPRLNLAACCLLALCTSACVSVNAYVENGHNEAGFGDLHGDGPPRPVRVVTEFKVNGYRKPEADAHVYNSVVKVLQHTNVLQPVSGDPGATLKVVVDDITDLQDVHGEGLQAGMTLGMSGVTARDDYHFTMTLQDQDGKPVVGSYRHAMITVAGSSARTPPSYGQPLTADDAFDVIVRQSLLEFLANVQESAGEAVMFVPDAPEPPAKRHGENPQTPN